MMQKIALPENRESNFSCLWPFPSHRFKPQNGHERNGYNAPFFGCRVSGEKRTLRLDKV
jgi:hypothetical protein